MFNNCYLIRKTLHWCAARLGKRWSEVAAISDTPEKETRKLQQCAFTSIFFNVLTEIVASWHFCIGPKNHINRCIHYLQVVQDDKLIHRTSFQFSLRIEGRRYPSPRRRPVKYRMSDVVSSIWVRRSERISKIVSNLSPGEDPETRRMRTVKNIADLRQNLEETMSSLRGTQISHR